MKTRKNYIIPALNVDQAVVSSMMAVSRLSVKTEDEGVTETSDVWTKEEKDWYLEW